MPEVVQPYRTLCVVNRQRKQHKHMLFIVYTINISTWKMMQYIKNLLKFIVVMGF